MMSLVVKSKTEDSVICKVVDGGELKSRRHLNVRGKCATLSSITEKDWDDIKFGVENKVDFYVVSFVKDAKVVHELKDYLRSCGADILVTVKIKSADSIPNMHSIISTSNGLEPASTSCGELLVLLMTLLPALNADSNATVEIGIDKISRTIVDSKDMKSASSKLKATCNLTSEALSVDTVVMYMLYNASIASRTFEVSDIAFSVG
ncbi:pyruvate kinase isozyme G, chloroplastic-like [Magnolia sinica]|uniref:pyruvate kinase isozyme G, chloroplastic-like n=1 Tax=Magnolia sinica TaxID=86752 RepID=UPI002657F1D0|nr:pyruvate kinase isozyme G, chloroplastic-like [Magnolia sinica]